MSKPAERFFVLKEGQVIGPFEGLQIIQMLRAQHLSLADLATPEGQENWHPLGNMIDPADLAQSSAAAVPEKKKEPFSIAGILVLCVLAGVVIFAVQESLPDSTADERMPFNAGKGFVLKALKAPSTAKFPPFSDTNCGSQQLGDDRWKVWGYVDAQNSFGATIRTEWTAVVEKRGTDWHRLFFQLGDETVGDPALITSTP